MTPSKALQQRQREYHERGYYHAPIVTKFGGQEPLCPFGKNKHDRHDRCGERRLFDGPTDTQIDVADFISRIDHS